MDFDRLFLSTLLPLKAIPLQPGAPPLTAGRGNMCPSTNVSSEVPGIWLAGIKFTRTPLTGQLIRAWVQVSSSHRICHSTPAFNVWTDTEISFQFTQWAKLTLWNARSSTTGGTLLGSTCSTEATQRSSGLSSIDHGGRQTRGSKATPVNQPKYICSFNLCLQCVESRSLSVSVCLPFWLAAHSRNMVIFLRFCIVFSISRCPVKLVIHLQNVLFSYWENFFKLCNEALIFLQCLDIRSQAQIVAASGVELLNYFAIMLVSGVCTLLYCFRSQN